MDVVDVDPAEAMLAKLAAMDLSLAQHLHAQAMNAYNADDMVNLSRAYQRISRSCRQSLALHARMKRERERAERDAPPPPPPPGPPRDERRIRARHDALRDAVIRVAWNEYERPDADEEDLADREIFIQILRDVVEKAAAHDTFGLVQDDDGQWVEQPLDHHIEAFCARQGLPPDAWRPWRDLPDPPD